MSDRKNTDTGILFVNNRKKGPTDPNLSGKLFIGDTEHWLDGWSDNKTMQLKFRPKDNSYGGKSDGKGKLERTEKEGKSEKFPDWKGSITTAANKKYYVSAWRREPANGGNPFLSIAINEPQQSSNSRPTNSGAVHNESEDDAPF